MIAQIDHSWTDGLLRNFIDWACMNSFLNLFLWYFFVFFHSDLTVFKCFCFPASRALPKDRSSFVRTPFSLRTVWSLMSLILEVILKRYFLGCFCCSFSWSFLGKKLVMSSCFDWFVNILLFGFVVNYLTC